MRFPLHLLIIRSPTGADVTVFTSRRDGYAARAAAARTDWAQVAGWRLADDDWPTGPTVPGLPPADDEQAGDLYWTTRHEQGADASCYVENHSVDLDTLDPGALAHWQNAIAAEIRHRNQDHTPAGGTVTDGVITTAEGVTYTPWTDGYAIGYRIDHTGRTEYAVLNPSIASGSDAADGDVFLYHGEQPLDAPVCYIHVLHQPGPTTPRIP